MKKTYKKNNNIFYLKIFFLIFFVTIFISIILKTLFLIRTSKLNQESFSVLVVGKQSTIYRINTNSAKIGVITIKNAPSVRLENNLDSSMLLLTPIDAIIQDENDTQKDKYFSPANIFSIITGKRKAKFINMNAFDLMKVGYLSQKTSSDNVSYMDINYSDLVKLGYMNDDAKDLLKNESIINRKLSVEVINATGIDGLGARVAASLESIGYNVVSIKSSDNLKHSEISYFLIPKEYASSISQEFGIPYKLSDQQSISDIRIILARDEYTKSLVRIFSD